MSGIRQWLEGQGLGHYAVTFEAHDIDIALLPQVDDQALEDIGVLSAGHRLRIRAAIAALTPAPEPASLVVPKAASLPGQEESSERRQLTVMFCDLVGFTALASRYGRGIDKRIAASQRALN